MSPTLEPSMSPIDSPTIIPTNVPTPSPTYEIPFYNKSFDEIVEILQQNATLEDSEEGSPLVKPNSIWIQFALITVVVLIGYC